VAKAALAVCRVAATTRLTVVVHATTDHEDPTTNEMRAELRVCKTKTGLCLRCQCCRFEAARRQQAGQNPEEFARWMVVLWVLGVGCWALDVELTLSRSVNRLDLTESGMF
jgi:hypothetical protein